MATISFHPSVPGFQSPAVGFEAPFEMLEACHERVQRMLGLLARLQARLETVDCEEQAKQAAIHVMRYFDHAAPQHHQDEELYVFPPLLKAPDAAMHGLVQKLQQQRRAMEETQAYPAARGVHTINSLKLASLDMRRRWGVYV